MIRWRCCEELAKRMGLVLATRNRKKLVEFEQLAAGTGIRWQAAGDLADAPQADETGSTFAENARLKAVAVAVGLRRWALADDSGLEVDALDGAPGVHSARYAGPQASDAANRARLLAALADVPADRRQARFVCHLVLAGPGGDVVLEASGTCRGLLLTRDRGAGGFGYDPLFLVPEYDRTFAELGAAPKSCLSHRARAFRLWWRQASRDQAIVTELSR